MIIVKYRSEKHIQYFFMHGLSRRGTCDICFSVIPEMIGAKVGQGDRIRLWNRSATSQTDSNYTVECIKKKQRLRHDSDAE